MEPLKSEIEIQAVNLTQQWYSLPHESLPELPDLLSRYLHCFEDPTDRQQFLKEALRIVGEMSKSPKTENLPQHYTSLLQEELFRHIDQ